MMRLLCVFLLALFLWVSTVDANSNTNPNPLVKIGYSVSRDNATINLIPGVNHNKEFVQANINNEEVDYNASLFNNNENLIIGNSNWFARKVARVQNAKIPNFIINSTKVETVIQNKRATAKDVEMASTSNDGTYGTKEMVVQNDKRPIFVVMNSMSVWEADKYFQRE
jgi:hypothetical protein